MMHTCQSGIINSFLKTIHKNKIWTKETSSFWKIIWKLEKANEAILPYRLQKDLTLVEVFILDKWTIVRHWTQTLL
jgi:hypothetical protein